MNDFPFNLGTYAQAIGLPRDGNPYEQDPDRAAFFAGWDLAAQQDRQPMTKAQAGSKGGRSTVAKHGREHMSKIGKAGARVTWQRYHLAPYGLTQYAMVRRDNNKIVRVIGQAPSMESILGG